MFMRVFMGMLQVHEPKLVIIPWH